MRFSITLLSALLVFGFVGCETETATPEAPPASAIQDFLDANPDYVDESGAESEEAEFSASEDE